MRREAGHDLLVNDREALLEQRLNHACSGCEGSDTAVRVRAQPGPHIFQTAATLRLREADQLIERCALDHGLEGCVRCDGPWSPECTVRVALVGHSNPHGRFWAPGSQFEIMVTLLYMRGLLNSAPRLCV